MIQIEATEVESGLLSVCEIILREGGCQMPFRVEVPEDLYQRLTKGKISKAECVKSAFRFLLDRESKHSILREFNLSVISQYFPEFEQKFKRYM